MYSDIKSMNEMFIINEWNVYNECKPLKDILTKVNLSQSRERCLSVFQSKNKLGMCVCWCENKLN